MSSARWRLGCPMKFLWSDLPAAPAYPRSLSKDVAAVNYTCSHYCIYLSNATVHGLHDYMRLWKQELVGVLNFTFPVLVSQNFEAVLDTYMSWRIIQWKKKWTVRKNTPSFCFIDIFVSFSKWSKIISAPTLLSLKNYSWTLKGWNSNRLPGFEIWLDHFTS